MEGGKRLEVIELVEALNILGHSYPINLVTGMTILNGGANNREDARDVIAQTGEDAGDVL